MKLLARVAAATAFLASAAASVGAPPEAHLLALRTAALEGDAHALVELAAKYEHAEGVAKDQKVANRLLCAAARQGSAEAQFRLGWAYANGRGGERDDAVAGALFAMAAQLGHEHAARMLQHVPRQPDSRLPLCMTPESPATVTLREPAAVATGEPAGGAERDIADKVLVRAVPGEVRRLVDRLAPEYAVDAGLALAVIAVESAFDAAAISPRNAQGLMQLIPETAARFGVRTPFDPVDNVRGGLAYLRWLLAFFEGDVTLVLAAYNAGERAVERYRGIPPYAETREYVRKISALYPKVRHPYEPAIVRPSALAERKRSVR